MMAEAVNNRMARENGAGPIGEADISIGIQNVREELGRGLHEGHLKVLARVLVTEDLPEDEKAATLFAEIDRSGFYRGTAKKDSRSLMNVTFRLATEKLETQFVEAAASAGLDGLKGHRSVGGLRASIYNAFPEEGVDALVAFMKEFERTRG